MSAQAMPVCGAASEPANLPTCQSANDLSVIIVNWNTRDLLADCLRSIHDTVHDLEYEVFVVDNASTDGSVAMVREQFPDVHLIENSENVGFARANNQVLAATTARYVLLLNPDAFVRPGTVQGMFTLLERLPELAAIGARLLNADGSPQFSGGPFPTICSEMLHRGLQGKPDGCAQTIEGQTLIDVDWASGACLMLRASALQRVGLLDEDYWLYSEEMDWCYRARLAGFRIGVADELPAVHLVQASSSQRLAQSLIMFLMSRAVFYTKHHSSPYARLYLLAMAVKTVIWSTAPALSPIGRNGVFPTRQVSSAYGLASRDCLREALGLRHTGRKLA